MNIYDIAEKAGVSIATVSRTLNGGPVKEKTKKRIMEIIEEEGYIPNVYAKNLNSQSVKIVGVFLPDIEDIYGSRIVAVLEKEMKRKGYDMILYNIGDGIDQISKHVSMMISRRIDALFVVGSKFQESPALEILARASEQMPVIGINTDFDHEGMYSVLSDDRQAIIDTIKTLFDRGHRSFVYLYDTTSPSGRMKLGGFCEGIEKVGLEIDDQIMRWCNRYYMDAKMQTTEILTHNTDVTAILCAEDELAVGAVKAVLEGGYKIPEEIAIVGYDNSNLSYCCIPEISSVDNLPTELVTIASDIFTKVISGEKAERSTKIKCKLVERGTT